jgi:hypothetical protein
VNRIFAGIAFIIGAALWIYNIQNDIPEKGMGILIPPAYFVAGGTFFASLWLGFERIIGSLLTSNPKEKLMQSKILVTGDAVSELA